MEEEEIEEVIEESPEVETERCLQCIKCNGFKLSLISFLNAEEKVELSLRCDVCGYMQRLVLSRENTTPKVQQFKSVSYCG